MAMVSCTTLEPTSTCTRFRSRCRSAKKRVQASLTSLAAPLAWLSVDEQLELERRVAELALVEAADRDHDDAGRRTLEGERAAGCRELGALAASHPSFGVCRRMYTPWFLSDMKMLPRASTTTSSDCVTSPLFGKAPRRTSGSGGRNQPTSLGASSSEMSNTSAAPWCAHSARRHRNSGACRHRRCGNAPAGADSRDPPGSI